eukprot:g30391.t1
MLHYSNYHPKHVKEAIPHGQALHMYRICTDEEDDGHLKMMEDILVRTGNDAQLIDRQFQHATVKNRNNLLRRQTQDTTDRVPWIVQYFPGAEKLHHVFCGLQHVTDDNEHLTKSILCLHSSPSNNHQTLERPLFAAKYPAFKISLTTTPHTLSWNVPSQSGNISAVKDIQPPIF